MSKVKDLIFDSDRLNQDEIESTILLQKYSFLLITSEFKRLRIYYMRIYRETV